MYSRLHVTLLWLICIYRLAAESKQRHLLALDGITREQAEEPRNSTLSCMRIVRPELNICVYVTVLLNHYKGNLTRARPI